jgi:tetratricopeptide (TPR) repeat protein
MLAWSFACKTTEPASQASLTQESQRQTSSEISNRARLLFEDANKTLEAARKANAYDFAALERKYKAVLQEDGRLVEAKYNLGVLAQMQDRPAEAESYYREVLKQRPDFSPAAVNLGVLAMNAGDLGKAQSIFQAAADTYPDDPESRARLASLYAQMGDAKRSIQLARESLYRDPQNLSAYKAMMAAYLSVKQYDLLRLVAARMKDVNKDDPDTSYYLGLAAMGEGKDSDAKVLLQRTLELDPGHLSAAVELAKMELRYENAESAEAALRRVLQMDGKNLPALVGLAVSYGELGQLDKAMQVYDQIDKLNPNQPEVAFNRGVILSKKEEPEKAIEYFKKYLQLTGGRTVVDHPVYANIRQEEAVILRREEDRRAAEEEARMEEKKKIEEQKRKEEEFQKAQKGAKGEAAP